jgi:hypothetical protein
VVTACAKMFVSPHLNRKTWAQWCTSVISATAGNMTKRISIPLHPGKKLDDISKTARAKKGMGAVLKSYNACLTSEFLSSNPNTAKKNWQSRLFSRRNL